ncbi:MAG: DUF559 domain-containing protein [Bacteroidales bacterium]|nr:DUF559 domain-containing protein [Bacteroidales bacterium]
MKHSVIPDYKDNLTWAARPDIFSKVKELRKSMTKAERVLWKHLRNHRYISQ